MSVKPRPCPACDGPKNGRHYLCDGCWWTLPRAARGPLLRRDALAVRRLSELLEQIRAGVPLHQITITTR